MFYQTDGTLYIENEKFLYIPELGDYLYSPILPLT